MIRGLIAFGTEVDMSAMLPGPALDAFLADFDPIAAESADDVADSIRRSLPAGVALEAVEVKRDGAVVTSVARFRFDDIGKLRALDVFFARGQPSVQPFASLVVEETAGVVEVSCEPPRVPPNDAGAFVFVLDAGRAVAATDGVVDGTRVSWRLRPGSGGRFFARLAAG